MRLLAAGAAGNDDDFAGESGYRSKQRASDSSRLIATTKFGVYAGLTRAVLRVQGVRSSPGLSHFVPGLWFVEAASRFWGRVLQSLLEDYVLLFLFFRL